MLTSCQMTKIGVEPMRPRTTNAPVNAAMPTGAKVYSV